MATACRVPMPLIHVQTSCAAVPEAETLLRELSAELATWLGKPERYVMTLLHTGVPMTFGGDTAPCAYVEVKSIGRLGVPADRIYIGFEDVPGRLWGWDGSTFG